MCNVYANFIPHEVKRKHFVSLKNCLWHCHLIQGTSKIQQIIDIIRLFVAPHRRVTEEPSVNC